MTTAGGFVLQHGQTVVMIGDSITDCGRRDEHAPLGDGYVKMVAALTAAKYPERSIRFVNTGIGGDTVLSLAQRWQADVLDHRPDWLSVSIGVNDVWRQVDGRPDEAVLIDAFGATYRELLEATRAALPGCGLILMTPGLIQEDPASNGNVLLKPYVETVKDLARDFDAFCVDIHRTMLDAVAAGAGRAWTDDGVHPNPDGHALMALDWLNTLAW